MIDPLYSVLVLCHSVAIRQSTVDFDSARTIHIVPTAAFKIICAIAYGKSASLKKNFIGPNKRQMKKCGDHEKTERALANLANANARFEDVEQR